MKPNWLLYASGHRLGTVIGLAFLSTSVAVLCGTQVLSIPWLRGSASLNVGTLCSLVYSFAPVIVYRNELSRLESRSGRSWMFQDCSVLAALWGTPWALSLAGFTDSQFAYSATIFMGIFFCLGRFMHTDTLCLIGVFALVVQGALWTLFSDGMAKYVLFTLSAPSLAIQLLVSLTFLLLAVGLCAGFKNNKLTAQAG